MTCQRYVAGRQITLPLISTPIRVCQCIPSACHARSAYYNNMGVMCMSCDVHSLIIFSSSDCSPMVWNLKEPKCWANVCCIFEYSVQQNLTNTWYWPGSILYKCKIVKSKHSDSVYMTASQPRPQASRFFKIQNLAYYFEKLGGRPRSEGGIKILGNIPPRPPPPPPEINVCNLPPIRPYTAKQLQHTVTMLHCNEGLNISGCTSYWAKQ